jgi:organic radical activating enzyme
MKWKGRLRLFPTLRCSASCPYCNNTCPDKVNFSSIKESGLEQYKQLFKIIAAEQVIIGGGEPALHRNFIGIVTMSQGFYNDTIIYTNGKAQSICQISKLKNEKLHICMSFHPTEISKEEFLEGYNKLKDDGFKFYWIAAVEDRYNIAQLLATVDWLKQKGMGMLSVVPNWYYEPLNKCVAGRRYKVKCYTPDEPPISPDLRVYSCHSRMFAQDKKYSYDILNGEKIPESVECDFVGFCSMCDRNYRKEEI